MKISSSSHPDRYNAALPSAPPQVIFSMVPVPAKFSDAARGVPPLPFDLLEQVNTIQLALARGVLAAGNSGSSLTREETDALLDLHRMITACAMLLYGCAIIFSGPNPSTITATLAACILNFNARSLPSAPASQSHDEGSQDLLNAVEQIIEPAGNGGDVERRMIPTNTADLSLLARSALVGIPGVNIQEDASSFTVSIDSQGILSLPVDGSVNSRAVLTCLGRYLRRLLRRYLSLLPAGDEALAQAHGANLPPLCVRLPRPPQIFMKCKFGLWTFLGDLHPGSPVGRLSVPAKATKWGRVETWEVNPASRETGMTIIDSPGPCAQEAFEATLAALLGNPRQDREGPAFFSAPPAKVAQGIHASIQAHIKAANAVRVFKFAEVPPSGAYAGIKGKARPGVLFLKTENPLASSHDISYISTRRDVIFVTALVEVRVTFTNGTGQRDFSYHGLDAIAPLLASPAGVPLLKKKLLAAATVTDFARRRLDFLQPPTGERAPAPCFVYTRDVPINSAGARVASAWDPFLKRARVPGVVMRVGQTQLIPPLVVRGDFDFKHGSDFQRVTRIPPEGLSLEKVAI